jgi:hypothetical protein
MENMSEHIVSSFLYQSAGRMKFLLSVADDYEFVCPAPAIYYDPVTYLPCFIVDGLDQEYRADFLIRHRENGQAFLVELHPVCMVSDARLRLRRQVAENYIAWKGYDWQYQCLFQEYILLSASQSLLFDSYCRMKNDGDRRKWLIDHKAMSDLLKPPQFQCNNYSMLDFLIHGILPKSV